MINLASHIPNAVSLKIGRTLLHTQKNSPTILFAAGVVGIVATAVSASRATLKMDQVLQEAQANLEMANKLIEEKRENYSEDDHKQDIVLVYLKTSVKIAKLYAPPIAIGILTIACLTKSHSILNRRNAGLAAAYTALDRGFREYRGRVKELYGDDADIADKTFRYDTRVDKYTRKTQEGSKEIQTIRVGPGKPSIYATFFDDRSQSWSPTPEYNLIWLRCQQNYFNDRLKSRGHVFLNEIYDVLGVDRTPAGSVVGWVMNRGGDEYIDFGVFNADEPDRILDFVQGNENAILLDFNVDGVIYDKI